MRIFAIAGLRALAQPFGAAPRHARVEVRMKMRALLIAPLLILALAGMAAAAIAAGTGPLVWRVGSNIGACGSFGTPIREFPSLDAAIQAQLAAMAANNCIYQQPTIIRNFPVFDIKASADPGENTSFQVSANCKTAEQYFSPDAAGVCNFTDQVSPEKAAGCDGCTRGNPASLQTGGKSLVETDYRGAGPFALRFARVYNSVVVRSLAIGVRWTHSYAAQVLHLPDAPNVVTNIRPDGAARTFRSSDAQSFVADPDVRDQIVQQRNAGGQVTGWLVYDAASESNEQYDAAGRLLAITNREGLSQSLAYSDGSAAGGVIEGTSTPLPAGLLTRVTDPFGRALQFGYDAASRIVRATDPAGGNFLYAYDAGGNLVSVTHPDSTVRSYHYAEEGFVPSASNPDFWFSLTGITDENGARHANYSYVDGRTRIGRSERTVGGTTVFRHEWSWHDRLANMTETDPLGQVRVYINERLHGVPRIASITGPACPSCGPASQTYDANGNRASRTDWNGNRTNYTFDLARNLETSRTEGLTSSGGVTPQTRTITTAWHATFRLPVQIAEPLRVTTNLYDADGMLCGARGALCSRTVQATTDGTGSQGFSAIPAGLPRTWSYTYTANGSVLAVNGPTTDLTDLTTYTYYANDDPEPGKRGNLAAITNAAGHTTQITAYNPHGQPTTIVDPNGLVTSLSYDSRQRLTSRSVGGETTSYEYDGVGQLTKVILPDGSFLSYSYDSAHRLTGIADNLGNRIAYSLDVMGNRTREDVLDPANALAQTRSRVYSNLNRLFQEIGAAAQVTEYGYDNQGNVTSVRDPLNRITSNQYDALNRLARVTDPASGVTQYGYNGLDALTQVSDPRNLVTGYTVDGLGNLTQQVSPDTGATTNTFDAAGNLLTQTDAKGQTTTYAYDALNRVISITFADGSRHAFGYDAGANAIGRLSSITETSAANQVLSQIAYGYDQKGRVASESRTVSGVAYVTAYAYDSAGRLAGITYPSGRSVTYAFDALGRVSQVSTAKDAQTQVVVQAVAYHPFGGVKGYTLGNGQSYVRGFDQDGRVASYSLGAQIFALGYDAASRIAFIADLGTPANSNTYSYDNLDRLTNAVAPGTPFAYSYDAVGNRLAKTVGAATDNYAYSATSNRIASIAPASGPMRNFVFDANGSTTGDGINQYAYDARGRLVQAVSTVGTSAYQVNALGQRIRKTNALGESVYHYDTQGRLIAETDPAGNLKREVIYLGDIPVGVVR